MISVNNLKIDSKNDNEKVMPSIPSPEPMVSYFDDLDYFKDFEKELPAIVYNDAQTSKLDFLTEPTLSPQHIDEFDLKSETSLSECDEKEENILYFNDLFHFNVIYPDDSNLDKDNDDDKIDIKQPSRGFPDCSLVQLDSGTTILQELWGMVTISWEMLLWSRCIHDRLHGLLLNLSSWLASFGLMSVLSLMLHFPYSRRVRYDAKQAHIKGFLLSLSGIHVSAKI
ncbi:hypothetical protein Tco_0189538 [Tanacetum coccineum]